MKQHYLDSVLRIVALEDRFGQLAMADEAYHDQIMIEMLQEELWGKSENPLHPASGPVS